MKKIAAGLLLLMLALPAFPQQEEPDFDSLFEGELLEEAAGKPAGDESNDEDLFEADLFEDSTPKEEQVAPEEAFLISEQLEWGGSFDLTFTAQVVWDGYPAPWEKRFWQAPSFLTPRLAADLFFDARPDRDFRIFGKVKAAYQYPADWDVGIFELFSDFQIRDLLFFRAGKQTVQWGVGYFFSPADVLNLVSIDPEDPEAEREGPIALKTHFPFAAHNAYLYLVANDITRPYQIAVAPKLELLLGNYELGLGGFFQPNRKPDFTPKGMLTLTGPYWDLDLFAEAMIQWRSDRKFYEPGGEPPDNKDGLLFSGTAGCGYRHADWNLSLFAQYLFNGQGYLNYDYRILRIAADTPAVDLTPADIIYPGRHYLAASIGWFELLDSPFSVSLLYLGNLSDGSGLITPTLTWEPIDHVSLSTGFSFSYSYGDSGDEYAPTRGSLAWTFSASLGAGRF